MDWNNIELLEQLYNFTYAMIGNCPNSELEVDNKCWEFNIDEDRCVRCWREALLKRIIKLRGKNND